MVQFLNPVNNLAYVVRKEKDSLFGLISGEKLTGVITCLSLSLGKLN